MRTTAPRRGCAARRGRCRPGCGAASRAAGRCRSSSRCCAARRASARSRGAAGLTACQMSMNGCPTISTCLPIGDRAMPCGDPALLGALDQVVDEDADPALRAGPEVAQVVGEVVDAAEVLDDDALDAQVVAPDLLDQLGVVAALDEDPAGPGDPGLRAVRRRPSPTRCGSAWRGRRRAPARVSTTGLPSSRKPGPSGNVRRLRRRSSSVTVSRSRSTATISPHQSVVTSSTTAPISAGVSDGAAALRGAPVGVEDVGSVAVAGGTGPR